ncbi:FAD-dependent oxidoreductase [Deinococcus sp. KNUC1210]|uniref:FAD-dependent oxidoreductase n=1 Tax=Deinococcus sp. KNUC1210 TaxID=2917691 RepID=UPI001EF06314|nr:FAD-dependent oxidoreductase [Deinococcus sp. KNUC1210]ULH16270.1 FAD-dependent oxidoreductase [Deinococcus sp. KNUC1210]
MRVRLTALLRTRRVPGRWWPFPLAWPLLIAATLLSMALLTVPSSNDLLVYGGTPQGVMAAVTAAQQGQRVVLIERGSHLGGVLTRGWLTTLDLSSGPDDQPLSRGLFLRLYRQLHHDNSFDVEAAQRFFNAVVRLPNLRVLTGAPLLRVSAHAGQLDCPTFAVGHASRTICAARYIDASDSADLAAQAGASFTLGRGDTGLGREQMAAGLIFRLRGVNWAALETALAQDQGIAPELGSSLRGRSLVGLTHLASGYVPSDPQRFHLRGFNGARQDDGSLMINALLVLGVDGTSPSSVQRARQDGDAEARRVTAYLKRALPQVFGRVQYGGAAPELYIRESRHLSGEYRFQADDAFYGHRFPDSVAVGGYPLDGQLYRAGDPSYLIGHPAPYDVPFRSLIPLGMRNLLVVSQAASFGSVAAFSTRVVPLQMTLGEAAGMASALSVQTHSDFQMLWRSPLLISLLRLGLSARGDVVEAPVLPQTRVCQDARSPQFTVAKRLLRRGLMSAPYYYQGCLHLTAPETGLAFVSDLQHGLLPGDLRTRQPALDWLRALYTAEPPAPLQRSDAQNILSLLHLPALPPGDNQPLTRAEAARLRYELLTLNSEQRRGAPY